MAILRMDELRDMDDAALEKKEEELQLEMAKERGRIAVGGFPENPGRIKEIRKTVARIKTVMNERQRDDG